MGLAKTIRNIDRAHQERAALDIIFDIAAWGTKTKGTFKTADVTVTEAMLVKLLKDENIVGGELRVAVQKTMDRLMDAKLSPGDIHPIWAEAQRALL